MRPPEFNQIGNFLREYSGAELGPSTMGAVALKLEPVLTEFDLPSIAHLLSALTGANSSRLRQRVAEALAVPESYFFRNTESFDYIAGVMLPDIMEQRAAERRLRIWSAACSSGQEPYSLAMLLAEKGSALDGWSIEIVASDFSADALHRARAGHYSQFEVQRGLPVRLLMKYFEKLGPLWQVKPEIRDRVVFQHQNLLHSYDDLGQFDIILCRNVLIYFGTDHRIDVLKRLAQTLAPDGYLMLGAAETTFGLSKDFKRASDHLAGVYRLASGRHEQADSIGGHAEDGDADSVASQSAFRSVRLDRATADSLEAMARACGMTVSAFLTAIAGTGIAPAPQPTHS